MAQNKDFIVKNGLVVLAQGSSASTSTTTGALIVQGGVGIGGALYAGNVYSNGSQVVTTASLQSYVSISGTQFIGVSSSTGEVVITNLGVQQITTGSGIVVSAETGTVNIQSIDTLQLVTARGATTNQAISITNNSNSTSTTTGALTVAGGVGIAGQLNVGGTTSTFAGSLSVGTTASLPAWKLYVLGGAYFSGEFSADPTGSNINLGLNQTTGNLTAGGIRQTGTITIGRSTLTQTLSVANGAIGAGITKTVNIGTEGLAGSTTNINIGSSAGTNTVTFNSATRVVITNQTTSTSGNTGALTVAGGIGVDGNLHVAGDTHIFGNLTVEGAQYVVSATTLAIEDKTIRIASTATIPSAAVDAGIVIGTGTGYVTFFFDGVGSWKSKGSIIPNGTQNLGAALTPWNLVYANAIYDNNNRVVTTVTPAAGAGIAVGATQITGPAASFTITNIGVLSVVNGVDTTVTTSTGNVAIDVTSNLQTVTARGATTNQAITITNLTAASSTITGALVVAGGVGVGKDLWIGGSLSVGTGLIINGAAAWTTASLTNNNQLSNGAGYLTSATLGLYGVSAINAGAGIGLNPTVGTGSVTVINMGVRTLTAGTDTAVSASTGTVTVWTTSTLQSVTSRGGTTDQAISITNATSASSTITGALTVVGGVGVRGSMWVGGQLATTQIISGPANSNNGILIDPDGTGGVTFSTSTQVVINSQNISNSTATGAMLVRGGMGVGGNIYAYDLYDNGRRVLTTVTPTAGTAISIASVSTGSGTTTFTINNTGVTSAVGTTYLGVSASTGAVTFTNLGVQSASAGTGIAVSASTGTITISSVDTLQLITGRGATTNQAISITNATAASTVTDGALTVTGGVGIGEDLYVGGQIYSGGNQVVTSFNLGQFGVAQVNAGTGISVVPPSGTGTITVSNTGVVGINGTTYIGVSSTNSNVTITNLGVQTLTAGTDTAVSASTGTVTVWTTATLQSVTNRGSSTNNAVSITNTTAASSTNTGALKVDGGVGIGGNLYVGGDIFDGGKQVLTGVAPAAGTSISITSVSTSAGVTSFTINNTGVTSAVGTAYLGVSAASGAVTFTNLGVQSAAAGSGIAVSASTGSVTISSTDTLQLVTDRGSTTTQAISITNATAATSPTTGALKVTGGVGIGGDLHVAGALYDSGALVWTTATLTNNNQLTNGSEYLTSATLGLYGVTKIIAGTAISISPAVGTGTVTINNTGVTSAVGTTYLGVSASNGAVTFTNLGVQSISTGSGITVSAATGTVTLASIDTLQLVTARGATTNQAISITNNTNGATTLTGALTVGGSIGANVVRASEVWSNGAQAWTTGSLTNLNQLTNGPGYITSGTLGLFGVAAINGTAYIGVSGNTGSVTITNLGVQQMAAGTETTVSNATGTVSVNVTSTLQNVTSRGATTNQAISITNTTNATTATSGALTVSGGVGVSGNLNVGGSMNVWGPVTFSSPVTFNGTATYVLSTNTIYTDNIVELHTTGTSATAVWGFDDGKDIGHRYHYYNRTLATGTNAALVLANDTQYLEWYSTGAEGTSTFAGASYGTFKTGEIELASTTQATSTLTGALRVAGGAGIRGNLYVGGSIVANGSTVVTSANLGQFGVAQIVAGSGITISPTAGTGTVTITNSGVRTAAGTTYLGVSAASGAVTFTNLGVQTLTGTAALGVSSSTGTVTLTNLGVTSLAAGADISVSASTGSITVSGTGTLQTVTARGATTNQAISITNATAATSPTTGALKVTGGVGIGGDLHVAGALYDSGALVWTTATLTNNNQLTNGAGYITSATLGTFGVSALNGTTYIGVSGSTGSVTITNLGVQTITTGSGIAASATTGTINIASIDTLQLVTARGAVTNQQVQITNNLVGATTNSGHSLLISGGIGANIIRASEIYSGGALVYTTSSLNNLNQLANGPGYITSATLGLFGVTKLNPGPYIGLNPTVGTGSVTVINLGVQTLTAGTDTSVSASTGTVTVWTQSTLQTVTSRGASTNQQVSFLNNTVGVSTNTGQSVVVNGGIGALKVVASELHEAGGRVWTQTGLTNLNQLTNGPGYITSATLGSYGVSAINGTTYLGVSSNVGSVTLTNLGVQSITTGSGIAASATTGTINIASIDTLQLVTARGATTNQAISITNATDSTSAATGALQVTGGIATGGDIFVGGNHIRTSSVNDRVKFAVWGDATPIYGMGMTSSMTYGGLNDYALTFQMSDTAARGFWWGDAAHTAAQGAMALTTDGKLTVASSARIGFGESDAVDPGTSYTLHVNGSFAATTKSFVIPHPTKEGKTLRYGSLEGPENGVYVRGRLTGSNTIELPDYWTGLVDESSITVDLTPIGKHQKLYVEDIVNNTVVVGNDNLLSKDINCFYVVWAERKDVAKLEVEF